MAQFGGGSPSSTGRRYLGASMPSAPAEPGDLGIPGLSDCRAVARGGYGTVYRAYQERFNRVVAVKVMSSGAGTDQTAFEKECRAVGSISGHPNIVPVYDAGTTSMGDPYLIMAYLSKGSLADRIHKGAVPWEEVARIGIKLCGALETVHRRGILHRDLKPGNVLVSDWDEPQLADFGIARIEGGEVTGTGNVAASLNHAPPEIVNRQHSTITSDVYSLASTLYTAILGRPPFERGGETSVFPLLHRILEEPPPDLARTGVPRPLALVLAKALSKDAARRPQSALAFGRDLQGAQRALGLEVTELSYRVGDKAFTERASGAPAPLSGQTRPGGRSRSTGQSRSAGHLHEPVPRQAAGVAPPKRRPAHPSAKRAAQRRPPAVAQAPAARRRSGVWGWMLGIVLVLAAFSAGLVGVSYLTKGTLLPGATTTIIRSYPSVAPQGAAQNCTADALRGAVLATPALAANIVGEIRVVSLVCLNSGARVDIQGPNVARSTVWFSAEGGAWHHVGTGANPPQSVPPDAARLIGSLGRVGQGGKLCTKDVASSLNIRSEPTPNSPEAGHINSGDCNTTDLGYVVQVGEKAWAYVESGSTKGWAQTDYLAPKT